MFFFTDGDSTHVDFATEMKAEITDSKLAALTEIFKAADFSQLLSPEYVELYGNQLSGSLALFVEMWAFRPNGVIGPDWKVIEDSSLTNFFFNNFFAKNFNDIMIQFFLSSGNKEVNSSQLHNIQEEAIEFANKSYQGDNKNITSLLVLSKIFSTIFSQQDILQTE